MKNILQQMNYEREQQSIQGLRNRMKDYTFINTCEYNKVAYDVDGFCSVDFIILKDNQVKCFLEVRTRDKIEQYNSLFLGVKKIDNMSKSFRNTVVLWFDKHNLENVYGLKYNDELQNCNIAKSLKGVLTRMIPKHHMIKGLDDICDMLRTME
jgi:hypothetical protein